MMQICVGGVERGCEIAVSSKAKNAGIEHIRNHLMLRSQIHSFFDSALIFALEELGVFAQVGNQPCDLHQIAERIGADEDALARLLRPASALNLLSRDERGLYRIPEALRSLLGDQTDESVIPWIRFMKSIAPRLFTLAQAVRGQQRQELTDDDFCLYGADLTSFTEAMQSYALTMGSELVNYLDLSDAHTLLDVACGDGTYALLLGRKFPHLAITMMDSPRVLKVAQRTTREFGLADRVHFQPGDVLQDPIPGCYDCILISNALHLIGPEAARSLVKQLFTVLNAGGKLVVQGQFLSNSHREKSWPVLLDLLLLCGSPRGQNHTSDEAMEWLQEAGFVEVAHQGMSLYSANSLVTGVKPARLVPAKGCLETE